jgi:hypothetical protein
MKTPYLLILLVLWFNSSLADFSSTSVWSHPLYAADTEPYILDIRGNWSTDCHPGEQKPIISEYTGDTVLIEFEIITDHLICNDVVTPFRVLVDMSDVVDSVPGKFIFVDVTIRYGGDEIVKTTMRPCILCSPVPPPRDVKPETGLYYSNGLEQQGLLLARQNQRMGAYPLIYDEAGSSEWVLGPGGIVEDTFFADLFESTGGQCLGCPPPDDPPQMDAVGKIAMLMDGPGVIQVRINDGLFTTYELLDFGYGSRDIGGNPNHRVPNLSGRWALVEDAVWLPQLPPSENNYAPFPLVFDIALESVTYIQPPIVTPPPTPPGYVIFSIRDKNGNEITQMKCDFGSDWANSDAEMVCNISDPEVNDGDTLYRIKMLSPERLNINWVGPTIPEIHLPTHIAVRVD